MPEGAIFTDEDTLKQYVNDGTYWVEHANCTGEGTDQNTSKTWSIYQANVRNIFTVPAALETTIMCPKIMVYEFNYEDEYTKTSSNYALGD